MTKFKLDLEPNPEVRIIGISSHVNDYRLCWSLNRTVDLSLTRRRKDIAEETSGSTTYYSVFDHDGADDSGRLTIINNHGSNGVLIKEQRQADYFLVVDQELEERMPHLLEKVRSAEFVLTAFPVDLDTLRSGHKLLL